MTIRNQGAAGAAGSALIEALVALVLMALAGSVLGAAATVSLRATRRAAELERLTAVAARELAIAEARNAPAGTDEAPLTGAVDPGTVRRLEVSRDDEGIATFAVQVTAPGVPPLRLVARTLANE